MPIRNIGRGIRGKQCITLHFSGSILRCNAWLQMATRRKYSFKDKGASKRGQILRTACRSRLSFGGAKLKRSAWAGLILFCAASTAFAASVDCTMRAAPIDVARISHRPEIKSFTLDANKLAMTALLKNGRALRLVQEGCVHTGAEAALWFESDVLPSDMVALSKIAFTPDIAKDIERSLASGKYQKELSETRLVMSASPTSYFSYTVVLAPAEHGMILSISYILG